HQIALASQEIYLIDGTVTDNIKYGTFTATDEQVIAAAQLSNAHEFILALPNGYETVIGENGKNLSGGQRQRLSLARALLKNPAIYIFDEATSAVDNETEQVIQQSLATLAGKHTTIMIAHRLSTVRLADQIFVMEAGRVIETGTHDELLARAGVYANLWQIQTGTAPDVV
ncbi:MAG TPA: ATP-binding cassette domain-containing protein, partial [Candidatus Babeliales bacterium]|nr:ATP-binding cassette domain-containing protein [Candidatus Babeliales bacterium]